jgi:Ca2+-binding EF-hand superfamily protein
MKTIPLSLIAAGLFVPVIARAQPAEGGGGEKRPPASEESTEGGRPPGPPPGERPPRGGGGRDFEKGWKHADADGNGMLSRSEFDSMPRIQKLPEEKREHIFKRLDKNSDGVLSNEEMKMDRPRGEGGHEAMMRFRQLDTDGSGGISLDEMKAGDLFKKLPPEKQEALFARLDTDGDGQITVKDRPVPPLGPDGKPERPDRPDRPDKMDKGERPDRQRDPRRILRDFDENKDGSLSFEEFRNAPQNRNLTEDEQEDRFESLDKNSDKKIDETDFPPRPDKPEGGPPPPPPGDGNGPKPDGPPPSPKDGPPAPKAE